MCLLDVQTEVCQRQHSEVLSASLEERLLLKLANRLVQVTRNSMLDDAGLKAYLTSLQRQHKTEMPKLTP